MSVAAIGWFANAQFVLAPLCLVAAVAIAIVVKDDKKVVEIRKQEEEADRAAVA